MLGALSVDRERRGGQPYRPMGSRRPTLEIAIEGGDIAPADVTIKHLAELLEATHATLEAVAKEQGIQACPSTLVAIKEGSAAYELVSNAPAWSEVLIAYHEAIKIRGRGHSAAVRRGLVRMHEAGRIGNVRSVVRAVGDRKKREVRLALPIDVVPTVHEMHTDLFGRVVGLFETEAGRTNVRLACVGKGRVDLTCDHDMASRVASVFGKNVRARVAGNTAGDSVDAYRLLEITPWADVDLLGALLDAHDELRAEGAFFDPDAWIAEVD